MPSKPSHITALPTGLLPVKSSTQLLKEHLDSLADRGEQQKVVSLSFDFGSNYISMLKKGELLPMSRVVAIANALGLNEHDRAELLNTRLMEMHGQKGVICMETIATWAAETYKPRGDLERLQRMWEDAIAPAPHLLGDLLKDPVKAARIADVMKEVVQAELTSMTDMA